MPIKPVISTERHIIEFEAQTVDATNAVDAFVTHLQGRVNEIKLLVREANVALSSMGTSAGATAGTLLATTPYVPGAGPTTTYTQVPPTMYMYPPQPPMLPAGYQYPRLGAGTYPIPGSAGIIDAEYRVLPPQLLLSAGGGGRQGGGGGWPSMPVYMSGGGGGGNIPPTYQYPFQYYPESNPPSWVGAGQPSIAQEVASMRQNTYVRTGPEAASQYLGDNTVNGRGGGRGGLFGGQAFGYLARATAFYAALRAGTAVVGSMVKAQTSLNDALVEFQVQTGKSAQEARSYFDTVSRIGAATGIKGAELMTAADVISRVNLPQSYLPVAAQLQRAYGIPAEQALQGLISGRAGFPGMAPSEIGDYFTRLVQHTGFTDMPGLFKLFTGAAPLAQKFGMNPQEYTTLITAMGRAQPERSEGTIERLFRNMELLYTDISARAPIEAQIGPIISKDKQGRDVYRPLLEVMQGISGLDERTRSDLFSKLPSMLGQPVEQFWTAVSKALEGGTAEFALKLDESAGSLEDVSQVAMQSFSATIEDFQSAWDAWIQNKGTGAMGIIQRSIHGWTLMLEESTRNTQAAAGSGYIGDVSEEQYGIYQKELFRLLREDPNNRRFSASLYRQATPSLLAGIQAGRIPMEVGLSLYGAQAQQYAEEEYKRIQAERARSRRLEQLQTVLEQAGLEGGISVLPTSPWHNAMQIRKPGEYTKLTLPEGVTFEQASKKAAEIKEREAQVVGDLTGAQYELVRGIEQQVVTYDQAGKAVGMLGLTAEETARLIQELGRVSMFNVGGRPGVINTTLAVGPTSGINIQDMQKYMGERAFSVLQQVRSAYPGISLDEASQKVASVYGTQQQLFAFSAETGQMQSLGQGWVAFAQEYIRKMEKLYADETSVREKGISRLASSFSGFISGALSTTSVTQEQLTAAKAGLYREQIDEPVRQANEVIENVLRERRGEHVVWKDYASRMREDPTFKRLFPDLSAPAPVLRTQQARMREQFESYQIPEWYNWDALLGQYSRYVQKEQGQERFQREVAQRLPSMARAAGIDTSRIQAWAEQQGYSPYKQYMLGGKTEEETQADMKELGKDSVEAIKSGIDAMVKDEGPATISVKPVLVEDALSDIYDTIANKWPFIPLYLEPTFDIFHQGSYVMSLFEKWGDIHLPLIPTISEEDRNNLEASIVEASYPVEVIPTLATASEGVADPWETLADALDKWNVPVTTAPWVPTKNYTAFVEALSAWDIPITLSPVISSEDSDSALGSMTERDYGIALDPYIPEDNWNDVAADIASKKYNVALVPVISTTPSGNDWFGYVLGAQPTGRVGGGGDDPIAALFAGKSYTVDIVPNIVDIGQGDGKEGGGTSTITAAGQNAASKFLSGFAIAMSDANAISAIGNQWQADTVNKENAEALIRAGHLTAIKFESGFRTRLTDKNMMEWVGTLWQGQTHDKEAESLMKAGLRAGERFLGGFQTGLMNAGFFDIIISAVMSSLAASINKQEEEIPPAAPSVHKAPEGHVNPMKARQ